jgi:hypothetical protein
MKNMNLNKQRLDAIKIRKNFIGQYKLINDLIKSKDKRINGKE